jgi:predicted nucleotidyltransferase
MHEGFRGTLLPQNRRDSRVDQIPDRVNNIIRQFINELERNDIHITQAALFGSYATGTYDDWSDIDLALVQMLLRVNVLVTETRSDG